MLIDEIKKAKMEALKTKNEDVKSISNVIINKYMLLKIEKKEKNEEVSDVDVINLITKTLKELEEEKQGYLSVGNMNKVSSIENQIAFISSYLPKMLSEEEIKEEILKLDDHSIPVVMKHFKTNFAGKVDMGLVNKVLRLL